MTTSPPEAPSAPPPSEGPRVSRDDVRDLDRLRRTVGPDRYVAGVSGGVARHLDIDPAIVRVLFVVLAFFGGTGLLLYVALWLLLPEDGSDRAVVGLDSRSLTVAIVAVLGLSVVLLVGDSWGGFGFPWPLTVIGIIVAVVLLTRDRHDVSAPIAPAARNDPAAGHGPAAPAHPAYDSAVAIRPSRAPGARGVPDLPRPTAPQRPRDPRRRGPILFWFTLAGIALGGGILGIADVSGLDVAASAYPALALAITAVMLLVGSVYGRAGGLILLGLVIAPFGVVATVADNYEGEDRTEAPRTAAGVSTTYSMEAGELTVDLRGVTDPEELDGRMILVDGGIGRIDVILPDGVDVDVSASVDGPGNVSLFGRNRDGFDPSSFSRQDVTDEVATFTLDISLGVGEIVVTSN